MAVSTAAQSALAGLLAIAAGAAVQAQPGDGLETIVVWAEKREAPMQDVPIAMSALTSEMLSAAGITDADGLAKRLPSLDLQRNAGLTTTSLRIRRIGNIGNIPTFEPAVGVFVDGAFRSRSFLGTSNLLAVDHVEVLRGPQSALYGKNVSAGVLAIYTREPGGQFHAHGEVTRGRIDSPTGADMNEARFDLSGPIGSNLGAGIAAQFVSHGHTLTNVLPGGPDGNDKHQTAIRGQLAWSPMDTLDLRLVSGYTRERGDQGESEVFLAPGAGSTQVSELLQQLGLTPNCEDNVPRNRKLCSVATNELDLEAIDVTLHGEYRLANDWRFASMTSWDQYDVLRIEDDAIQLFAPMVFYRDAEQGQSLQEEIHLQSADGADFAWLVGGFYYRNVYERGDRGREPMFGANAELAYDPIWPVILGGLPLAIPGQLGIHDSELETRYLSVFAQGSWRITPEFSLTAGVRWQEEEKDASIRNSVTEPGVSLISAILTPTNTLSGEPVNGALSRSSETVPWTLTPQYRFGEHATAYVTLAHGSKSGGFNTGFGDAPLAAREFADEDIHHYELGAKTSFANRRVLLNTAAFYTRYDDYQDSAFISAQFSVSNAERVDLKGVELEGAIQVHDGLSMDFSVSFADLEYVANTNGLCYPGREPDGSSPSSCVLSGKRPIHAPEWETHLNLNYELPLRWGDLFMYLGWSWSDDYNTSFSADPRLVQGDHSDVAMRIGMQIGPHYQLVLWGDNLLDENVSHFDSLLNLFNDGSYQSYLAAPRSYGMSLRFRL